MLGSILVINSSKPKKKMFWLYKTKHDMWREMENHAKHVELWRKLFWPRQVQ
jgi:hypothetical protein